MTRALIVTAIVALATLASAQSRPSAQTFTGLITDNECPMADHKAMQMGANDAECVAACWNARLPATMLLV